MFISSFCSIEETGVRVICLGIDASYQQNYLKSPSFQNLSRL